MRGGVRTTEFGNLRYFRWQILRAITSSDILFLRKWPVQNSRDDESEVVEKCVALVTARKEDL